MIKYRKIDYKEHQDRDAILEMYQNVFHIDAAEQYDFLYRGSHFSDPLGVIAYDDENGKVVGHFTTVSIRAIIKGESKRFRMSMGFMTDAEYRGRGIATNLYYELKKLVLSESGETLFIIGFPNENSVHMHIDRMEYKEYRTFHFVELPKDAGKGKTAFTQIDQIEQKENAWVHDGVNELCHDDAFLNARYADSKYEMYRSEAGNLYICTQFRDKFDILYWSDYDNEDELLAFAEFLHQKECINRVTTWNTTDYLNKYPGEDRDYHMCINYLECDDNMMAIVNQPWVFFMGDCELF